MLYRPSTFPGGRAPHAWIAPGRSTLDLFGRAFTLLVFDPKVEHGSIMAAARRINVPISIEKISDPEIAEMYERPLVLVRPDGHVAWRSDAAAADPDAILSQITGHRAPAFCKR